MQSKLSFLVRFVLRRLSGSEHLQRFAKEAAKFVPNVEFVKYDVLNNRDIDAQRAYFKKIREELFPNMELILEVNDLMKVRFIAK